LGVVRREYEGAAFYVPLDRSAATRLLLRNARLTSGLEET